MIICTIQILYMPLLLVSKQTWMCAVHLDLAGKNFVAAGYKSNSFVYSSVVYHKAVYVISFYSIISVETI